ncbi:MAG: metal ABC transporter permease [Alphaproteobacteria bacterium]|nr:metal ABC transporter permease [Alphaproteobacteria bacterium]
MGELLILLPALTIGLLMMLIHVPLGQEVLRRGIIFIDLSLAQLAAMGAIFAGILGLGSIASQAAALFFAFLGGLFFKKLEMQFKEIAEAVIGCTFVLSATLAILAVAGHPHGAEHINDILSGQLLFASWQNVLVAGTVFLSATLLIYAKPEIFLKKYFYVLLAVVITTSVQVCGVYLVFASLIFPAVATSYMKNEHQRRITEYLGESFGFIIGLIFSYYFDLPAGPSVVWGISLMMPICLMLKSK